MYKDLPFIDTAGAMGGFLHTSPLLQQNQLYCRHRGNSPILGVLSHALLESFNILNLKHLWIPPLSLSLCVFLLETANNLLSAIS